MRIKKTALTLALVFLVLLSGCREKEKAPETENIFTIKPGAIEEPVSEATAEPASETIIETENEPEQEAEPVSEQETEPASEQETEASGESAGLLSSTGDVELTNPEGDGKNYLFSYNGEAFQAIYTPDNWKVIDSFRITKEQDITIICQVLLDEHPIHGADGASYRTAEDAAFEWIQHNLAYELLPEDNPWRAHAKDVDLNPEDQGKTFDEMYEDRTGKKFDPRELLAS